MKVNVRNNNVDKALSIFKRKTQEVVREVREREFYEKPSDYRRKLKQRACIKEIKRQENDKRPA